MLTTPVSCGSAADLQFAAQSGFGPHAVDLQLVTQLHFQIAGDAQAGFRVLFLGQVLGDLLAGNPHVARQSGGRRPRQLDQSLVDFHVTD